MSFYPIPGGFVLDDAGSSKTSGMTTGSQATEGEAMVCDTSEHSTTAPPELMTRDDGAMEGGVAQSTSGVTAGAQHETPFVPDVDTLMTYDAMPRDIPSQDMACSGAPQLVPGGAPGEQNETPLQPGINATLVGDTSQRGAERMGRKEHVSRPLSRDVPTMEDISRHTTGGTMESTRSEQESEVSDSNEHMQQ